MKLSKKMISMIGWAGMIVYLAAYTLNSLGFISSTGPIYGFANFAAGILLAIRVAADKNWSNFVLELFFILVAVINLVRFFFF